MLIMIVVLLVIAASWMVFKPVWLPAPPETEIPEKVSSGAKTIKAQSSIWLQQVRTRFARNSGIGMRLTEWLLQEGLAEKTSLPKAQYKELAEFQLWFTAKSADEAEKTAQELAGFCRRQGVDIDWLLNDGGKADMQAALASMVVYYGMALRERAALRPNAALRSWQDDPLSRSNRAFGTQLYIRLVDAGLITTPADLLMSPEKERQRYVVGSIRDLIDKDRDVVLSHAVKVLQDSAKEDWQPFWKKWSIGKQATSEEQAESSPAVQAA